MMTSHSLACTHPHGTHQISYTQWGEADNPKVLFCVHGFTRNRRDFDYLAAELASEYRILCPDLVGHGDSDCLTHSKDYQYTQYITDILGLLTHLNLKRVNWLGTSMGGLIGMSLAVRPQSPIKRLILNDIGPVIPNKLIWLFKILKQPQNIFENESEVKHFLRSYIQVGELTEAQWQHVFQHSTRFAEDGSYRLAFDPNSFKLFQSVSAQKVDLWSIWETISCPTLVLHGKQSAILTTKTITRMRASHPNMQVITFPGIGHAPSLMNKEHIQIVKQWLRLHGASA
jgi:pimeloyl-ACP methyl ester carboxylesterase